MRLSAAEVARAAVDLASTRPPLLGGARLICVDGPAGAGKTTLAQAIADTAGDRALVVHTDDVLQGWHGLAALDGRLRNYLVGPLASGHPSRMPLWSWQHDRPDGVLTLPPLDILVLEGVGSGGRGTRSRRAALVWVEAPTEVSLARGVVRDGEEMREDWVRWQDEERELFARHRTRELADLRYSTDSAPPAYELLSR